MRVILCSCGLHGCAACILGSEIIPAAQRVGFRCAACGPAWHDRLRQEQALTSLCSPAVPQLSCPAPPLSETTLAIVRGTGTRRFKRKYASPQERPHLHAWPIAVRRMRCSLRQGHRWCSKWAVFCGVVPTIGSSPKHRAILAYVRHTRRSAARYHTHRADTTDHVRAEYCLRVQP